MGSSASNWENLADSVEDIIWFCKFWMVLFAGMNPGVKMFVGEWALDQMTLTPEFLAAASREYYKNFVQEDSPFMGLAIWNYDGIGGW